MILIDKYLQINALILNDPGKYYFVFILIGLIPLFLFLVLSKAKGSLLVFILNLPGTILHELLHFFIGMILLAKPVSFSIIPKRDPSGGWVLGSVGFNGLNQFNALPTAMAPLLAPLVIVLVFPDIFFYLEGLTNGVFGHAALFSFFIASFFVNCIPSSADFDLMFSYKIGLIGYFVFCVIVVDHFLNGGRLIIGN